MYHFRRIYMKSMKLFTAIALATIASTAAARSSFNLFLGPQPCYYPAPMPFFPAPAPTVGFSMRIPLGDPCDGAPTLGFSVDVPLVEPVVHRVVRPRPVMVTRSVEPVYVDSLCRDTEDKRYWRIYNDTDRSIQVISKTESKEIAPGESRKLDHSTSFTLKVTDGDQKIRVRTTHHTLSIRLDQDEDLKICRA